MVNAAGSVRADGRAHGWSPGSGGSGLLGQRPCGGYWLLRKCPKASVAGGLVILGLTGYAEGSVKSL